MFNDFLKITLNYYKEIMPMKNRYKPLLNWDNVNKLSNNDKDANLKNKGILFEDIIECLLISEYGEKQWRRTIESHDGKRDFVYPYDPTQPDERWAECKNYAENISINVLSPTLFMAVINQVPCVYFYSYSPLNDNAIINIIQYSKLTGKVVKIFDGHFLEQCIYSKRMLPGICSKFEEFPKSFPSNNKVRIIKTLLDTGRHPLNASYKFYKGEKFFINVTLQNLSLDTIDCEANLEIDNTKCSFANTIYCGKLECGQIIEFLFPCEALGVGIVNYGIHLHIDDQSKQIKGKLVINDTPFTLLADSESLGLLDMSVNALSASETNPLIICGGSGYGKTTFLHSILSYNDIREKYHIIQIRLDIERNVYFANLFCNLIGIDREELTPEDQKKELEILRPYFAKYAQSAKQIVADIVEISKIIKKPILFVVDDAQNITVSYINFLRELRNAADYNAIKIIFALNTDKMSYEMFLEQLNWDQYYENRPCKKISLQKFNKEKLTTYFIQNLGVKEVDPFFKNFDGSITPMELKRLVVDLQTKKIIAQTRNEKFAIVDRIKFKNYLNQKLYADFSLEEICANLKQGDLPLYLLRYISLVGYLPITQIKRFKRTVDSLIKLCILKIDRDRVVFYHDSIKEKASLLNLDSDLYADICSDDVSPYVRALCAFRAYDKIQFAADYIDRFFAAEPYYENINQRYNICLSIIENLNTILKTSFAEKALLYIKKNLSTISREQPYEKMFRFLEKIKDISQKTDWDITCGICEAMLFLNKKYLDRCLSTKRNNDCIQWGSAIIEKAKTLKQIPDTQKAYWLYHFYNRMAIAHERLSNQKNNLSEAENCYQYSAEYIKIAGNPPELILQQVADNFNRAYVYNHRLSLSLVQDSIRQLEKLKLCDIERKACLHYHLCLFHYVEQKLSTSKIEKSFIDEMLEKIKCAECGDINFFYKFKLLMLKAYLLLEENKYAESYKFVLEAEQLAYDNEMRSNIYKLSYIKAQLLKIYPELDSAGDPYELSIASLMQFLDVKSYDIQRNINILHRLLTDIKAVNEKRYHDIIEGQSSKIREELDKILGEEPLEESYFRFHDIDFPII